MKNTRLGLVGAAAMAAIGSTHVLSAWDHPPEIYTLGESNPNTSRNRMSQHKRRKRQKWTKR